MDSYLIQQVQNPFYFDIIQFQTQVRTQVNSYVLLTRPHHLSTSLTCGTRCSILYLPCTSPGISHFSKCQAFSADGFLETKIRSQGALTAKSISLLLGPFNKCISYIYFEIISNLRKTTYFPLQHLADTYLEISTHTKILFNEMLFING